MRFLEVSEHAGGYAARLSEQTTPVAGPGEVLIRVAASGVNRADLSQIAGRYPPPPGESTILGLEVSGTVEATGEPVCALLAGGGHAEYAAVPVGQTFPVPPRMDVVSAAGIPEAFLTAFVNLVLEAQLRAGQTALVHAGASGVGLAAIQLAKFLGARVAATTRSREKLPALARAGADIAIHSPSEDVVTAIESRWGAGAVDVILDPIGAATLAPTRAARHRRIGGTPRHDVRAPRSWISRPDERRARVDRPCGPGAGRRRRPSWRGSAMRSCPGSHPESSACPSIRWFRWSARRRRFNGCGRTRTPAKS
jgi:NADPH:quinone reductase-like Zn-dependent oxidoreductase